MTLSTIVKSEWLSSKTCGIFRDKKKLAINNNAYCVPCNELTSAGFANDTEKISNNSDAPPASWPRRNNNPDREARENPLFVPFINKILFVAGYKTRTRPTGRRIRRDHTRTLKNDDCKNAILKTIYETAKRTEDMHTRNNSFLSGFPCQSGKTKNTIPMSKRIIACISPLVIELVR